MRNEAVTADLFVAEPRHHGCRVVGDLFLYRLRGRRCVLVVGIEPREERGQSCLLGVVHTPFIFSGTRERSRVCYCHSFSRGLQRSNRAIASDMPRFPAPDERRQPVVLARLSSELLKLVRMAQRRSGDDSRGAAYTCASLNAARSRVRSHFSLWQRRLRALAQGLPLAAA